MLKIIDTSFVKFVAILLITNSHLDLLYSEPRFATGGSLGNALFFALSGLGLSLSSRRHLPGFLQWINRRLFKIYPQVIIVLLLGGLITSTLNWLPLADTIRKFIWPTPYWFVAAIVVFYVPFYFVLRFLPRRIPFVLALSALPYFWFYTTALDLHRFSVENEYFRWLFYFPMMLFGAYLASIPAIREHRKSDGILLALAIFFYFGLKILLSKGRFGEWQFLTHLITFAFVFYSFRFFSNPSLLTTLKKYHLYFWVVALGELSLEVYLVQVYWIKGLAVNGISYPWGALLVWPLVFSTAWLVSIITKRLTGRFLTTEKNANADVSSKLISERK